VSLPLAHFLHVGKTGGTAIKYALGGCLDACTYHIILHPHSTTLMDVPVGEKFFFFLRDPLTRFISGFYSRQRRGQPRYNFPWSEGEAAAFGVFPTANLLAEALTDSDIRRRSAAEQAFGAIQHVRDVYATWFGDAQGFAARTADLLFVGFQERLDKDFEALKRVLGLPGSLRLPTDPVEAHRDPDPDSRVYELSPLARRNLEVWYAADLAFYTMMRSHAGFI